GERDIEREQPGGRRVDGHRGVHLAERDLVEERAHVAQVGDRHADLADLALGERVIAVVAGLGRQIEGDRETGLTLGEVLAIERVRLVRRRMAGISAEDPGPVAAPPGTFRWLAHASPRWLARRLCSASYSLGSRKHLLQRRCNGKQRRCWCAVWQPRDRLS